MSDNLTNIDLDTVSKEDLFQMLKGKQLEVIEAQTQLTKAQKEAADFRLKTAKIYEQNNIYKHASPEVAREMSLMEFQLSMAKRFIDGKAFKCASAEQAYVLIKAGEEMGLKPVESMQMLYCVNGVVKPWGDKMVGMILRHGYKVEYKNESPQGVDVRVFHPSDEIDFDVTEKVVQSDVNRGKAYGFAPKNKMRFHGVRMIVSFHLAHLFSGVSDDFTSDFLEFQQEKRDALNPGKVSQSKEDARVLQYIESATTPEYLELLSPEVRENYSDQIEAKKLELQPLTESHEA